MKHLDVAIAVIVLDQRVLICRRKHVDSFGGYWEFPGGKRELDESIEQCLRRELREELNVEVELTCMLPPVHHDYPHVSVTLHPFMCRLVCGQPQLIECQQLAWVLPGELGNYQFPAANAALIEQIIQRVV